MVTNFSCGLYHIEITKIKMDTIHPKSSVFLERVSVGRTEINGILQIKIYFNQDIEIELEVSCDNHYDESVAELVANEIYNYLAHRPFIQITFLETEKNFKSDIVNILKCARYFITF